MSCLHDRMVGLISKNPCLVGLDKVVRSETNFALDDKGHFLFNIDYWCVSQYDGRNELFIVEYDVEKNLDVELQVEEKLLMARKGLCTAGFQKRYDLDDVRLLFVHDAMNTDVLVNGKDGYCFEEWHYWDK